MAHFYHKSITACSLNSSDPKRWIDQLFGFVQCAWVVTPPDFSSRRSQMNYAQGGCVASSGSQDGKIAPVFVISRRAQTS
jgi:hypothetical protein